MRAAYVYFMKDDPVRVRSVAPRHAAHWRGLALSGYVGGPFTDRSGGLITFEAASPEEAAGFVAADPFVTEGLVERASLKAWCPD